MSPESSEIEPKPLSVEWAKTVPLSLNPLRMWGQLAAYGAGFCQYKVGLSPLPDYLTRGDLIRTAEAREEARRLLDLAEGRS